METRMHGVPHAATSLLALFSSLNTSFFLVNGVVEFKGCKQAS